MRDRPPSRRPTSRPRTSGSCGRQDRRVPRAEAAAPAARRACAGGGRSASATLVLVGAAVAGGAVVSDANRSARRRQGIHRDQRAGLRARDFWAGGHVPARRRSGITGHGGHVLPRTGLAGATVSTTLDSATATTDGAGNFDLTTTIPRSKIDECLTYTITITAAGLPTYTVNTRGFSGNEHAGSQSRQHFPYHRRRRPSWPAAARAKR